MILKVYLPVNRIGNVYFIFWLFFYVLFCLSAKLTEDTASSKRHQNIYQGSMERAAISKWFDSEVYGELIKTFFQFIIIH